MGDKSVKAIKKCALCMLLIAVCSITACSNSDRDENIDEKENMNVDFGEDGMIRNGTEYYTYQVEENREGTVSINISKKSGCLDIDIYSVSDKENPEYTGRNLDSTSFDVILKEPGEYKVRVTAEEYVGDYGISWRSDKDVQEE